MNLYQVKFDSEIKWIIADSFNHAHDRWKARLIKENPEHDMTECQPEGIMAVAEGTQFDDNLPEILLPDTLPAKEFEE